jgi:hypothetical protein
VIYTVVFTSVLVTDEPSEIPEDVRKLDGLNVTTAWRDLHEVART